jgi:exonuclease III
MQWNLNGYKNNYSELEILIRMYNPQILSLQETHIKENEIIYNPQKYVSYLYNFSTHNAKNGCGLLIHKSIPHKKLTTPQQNISYVAVKINTKKPFTILSIHIPPRQFISTADLLNIIANIDTSALLAKDFVPFGVQKQQTEMVK